MLRKLHDQNGVFARETDEHHEADLRENVVVLPGEINAAERAEQTHRHDEDDGQRQPPAFILRGEHEEDEEHAEREDVNDRVACEDLLQREVGPLEGEARAAARSSPRAPPSRSSARS